MLINNIITAQFLRRKKENRFQIVSSAPSAESECRVVNDSSSSGFVRAVCRTDWDEIQDVIGLFHDSTELISDWNHSQPA